MGLGGLYDNISQGLSNAKGFLGRAYHGGVKFAQGLDRYAGLARGVIGAVAPMVGSMGGPCDVFSWEVGNPMATVASGLASMIM